MIHRLIRKDRREGALAVISKGGRALVRSLPRPVELHQMTTPVRRSMIVAVELFVGLFVVGAVVIGVVYHRLEQGNIDLGFLVPKIEQAINDQLTDLSVRIESAFVGKSAQGRGVHFRVRNIVLYNSEGEAIANSPLAAVGLSLEALLWGKIAPSQMVFIEPTLDMTYREGEGISLSYARHAGVPEGAGASVADSARSGVTAEQARDLWKLQRVDFMKAVTAAFEEARSHKNTSSYLSQFGVRDAKVRFHQDGREFSWKVPDFVLDLRHDDAGSLIRGFGSVSFGDISEQIQPWSLRFQTQQFDDSKDLRVDIGVKDITTQSLAKLLPSLANVQFADLPISGKLTATLSKLGELQDSFANIQISKGTLTVPQLDAHAIGFDGGELKIAYSHKSRRLHILPSPLQWGENRTIMSGVIEPQPGTGAVPLWKFILKMDETRLGAPDFGLKPMIIDEWWAAGSFSPENDVLSIDEFVLRAGGAAVRLGGRIAGASTSPAINLSGTVTDISLPILKRLWPGFVAPDTREWLGLHVIEGRIASGQFAINLPAGAWRSIAEAGDVNPDMVQVDLRAGDIIVKYVDDLLPANIPEANLAIRGRKFSAEAQRGRVDLPSGKNVRFSNGSLVIADLRPRIPEAEMAFRVAGNTAASIEYLNQPTLKYVEKAGIGGIKVDGDVSGVVKMRIPLKKKLRFEDLALKGDFRVVKLQSDKLFAEVPIEGGSINIALSEKAVGADGGVVIKGVPAKVSWQRIFGGSDDRQPPLRFSAVLNGADRKRLGLETLDQYVAGEVPVVVTVGPNADRKPDVQVRADLTGSSIDLGAVQWKKNPGSAAVLQFDVDQTSDSTLGLRHVSLVAREFFLEGDASIDASTGQVTAFNFPKISYKLVNTMDIMGHRLDNGILSVVAKVKSLDGRTMLRPLIIAPAGQTNAADNVLAGVDHDLVADIDTIIGDQGASIRGAHLETRRRGGVLEWLDFKGQIDQRSLAAVRIEREEDGKRYLKAESYDAGATLRLLGLYANIDRGQLSLKIDMGEKGDTEKSGTLWVKNFAVVGTQLSEQDPGRVDPFRDGITNSGKVTSTARTENAKSYIHFDQLKAPFSYGGGRFDLHESYLNGPVLGATLRGYIDFHEEIMKLSGTYVPLYGLNSAVGEIPLLNELLIGRQGEGVFGVTFALEGPTANPVIVVNPVSLLAPGVFRQIFDFNPNLIDKKTKESAKQRQKKKLPKAPTPMVQ